MTPLYDAHNHFQDPWLEEYRDLLGDEMPRLRLKKAVVNGTLETDWPQVDDLARRYAWVLPSYGLHPWHVGQRSSQWLRDLRDFLVRDPRAVLGEIGLDRWILDGAATDDARLKGLRRASLGEQREVFAQQLALARELDRPATIHCLQAWGALEEELSPAQTPPRGFLLHAYGGSVELMKRFVDRGAYFSFNGYFLGDRHAAKREVFRSVPLDRLLVETDAPAMPLPEPRRAHTLPSMPDGTPVNHPGNIGVVYEGLAQIRGLSFDELASQVAANFLRLFGPSAL